MTSGRINVCQDHHSVLHSNDGLGRRGKKQLSLLSERQYPSTMQCSLSTKMALLAGFQLRELSLVVPHCYQLSHFRVLLCTFHLTSHLIITA